MWKIWLWDAPQEYNQYKWYELVYYKLSTEKLLLKKKAIMEKSYNYYEKQREVKHWSWRFWKIDNILDDLAASQRAIKKILDDREYMEVSNKIVLDNKRSE